MEIGCRIIDAVSRRNSEWHRAVKVTGSEGHGVRLSYLEILCQPLQLALDDRLLGETRGQTSQHGAHRRLVAM